MKFYEIIRAIPKTESLKIVYLLFINKSVLFIEHKF